MTKEEKEALEELKEIRFNLNYKVNGTSRFDKALNMAIKLLEQEPRGDCISREETLNALMDEWTEFDSELIDYLIEKVKKLPPVTPQQEIGYWEWVQYDGNPNIGNWHCSKCRTIIPNMLEETDNTPIYKWCPMCGTKMQKARIKNECL